MAHQLVLRLLFFTVGLFPQTLLKRRDRIAGLCWRASAHLRRVCTSNGRSILGPDASEAQLADYGRGVLAEFLRFVADIAMTRRMTREAMLRRITAIDGHEHFLAALNRGRGLIIATCHAGNFEVGAAAVVDHVRETHVLFQRDHQGGFERMRAGVHRRLGLTEAYAEEGLGAWIQLRDALSRGGAVLIQADRCMPGQRGTATDFLFGRIEMPDGPAKLSRLTGAPILPIACLIEEGGGTRLIADRPIQPPTKDTDDYEASVRERLAGFFSGVIRSQPTQWHILHAAFVEEEA